MTHIILDNGSEALCFDAPAAIIAAWDEADIPRAFDDLYRANQENFHLAGFFSYELGYLLDPKTTSLLPASRKLPLLWFIATREPKDYTPSNNSNATLNNLKPDWSAQDYIARCQSAKDHIAAGNIYQLNLTFRARFNYTGTPEALYQLLRKRQPVAHGGFIQTDSFSLASLSPELFAQVTDGKILTRPMKGTAPRDTDPAALAADPKNRAENLMIVDLMRNDLGRIAQQGSVSVPSLFAVETHPTLHQMTSDVIATLRPGLNPLDIIRHLFPAGSITGAPKLAAMQIIRDLEDTPRGAYCGAIGHIAPNGDMRFNVAIRTLTLWPNGTGETGIGSGVVADSDPQAEYDECLLKMKFLEG